MWWRDKEEFAKRFEECDWKISEVAAIYGTTRDTISAWRRRHGIEYPSDINPKDHTRKRDLPPLVPIHDEQITLQGDYAVSSDWHAPIINYEVHSRFLHDAQQAGLTRCIIAGDLTNQDSLSKHEEKQRGAELEPEMEHLEYAIDSALDVFDEIVVTFGNHDRHAMLALKVSFDRSLRMLLAGLSPEKLARIKVTALDNVIVETDRGPWLVCHTRSYSRQPLAYPNKLALRHNMHIAGAHRHHHAIGVGANGKTIVELGGLMDSTRLAYTKQYTTDMPEIVNGYGLLIDGHMRCPMLYS